MATETGNKYAEYGPGYEPPAGVTLLQTLEGHSDWVRSLSFDPSGRMLGSGSDDRQVILWDWASGKQVRTLEGHERSVFTVSFDPSGRMLASGSNDECVILWDYAAGKRIRALQGHSAPVHSVSFAPSGHMLASGGNDNRVILWDSADGHQVLRLERGVGGVNSMSFHPSGRVLAVGSGAADVILWDCASIKPVRTLKGHQGEVQSVSFDPLGRKLASGGWDGTVKLWDWSDGKLLRTLEGHTRQVGAVVFSADGSLLASTSRDGSIRLWRCNTWEQVASLPRLGSDMTFSVGLAFHPQLPILAAASAWPDTSEGADCKFIHLWQLNLDVLLGKAPGASPPARVVPHTTARIVLVGDSGVGKTALGWRLAHGEFKEQSSTHGQQFWVLDQLRTRRSDGTECEAILWDLAGQPDYRLTHALFLDEADLALIVFDSADTHDPLRGVEFWLKQLSACGRADKPGEPCPKLLIGARADRGVSTLMSEELDAFCGQRGIRGHISTSALTGDGLEQLVQRMKDSIPWNDKPPTVTTATFKRIKDYVLQLKENRAGQPVIVSPHQLRDRLEKTDASWEFSDDEMMTAVGHLENYGYVKRLRTSRGEQRILLAPELLNNLAASFVLEARRNPKGLGALEEERLLAGEYRFAEIESLSPGERDILLDSVTLLFLEHHVCFRETDPLTSQSYLVFPELINLKTPPVKNEQPVADRMAYTVSGAVENVYASLVVLLGYTQTFTRTAQWRNHAEYEIGDKLVCGFRQEAERDADLDFVLHFGTNVGKPIQTLFQGLFEAFLARRNLTVFRYEPVVCPKCKHPLDRTVVRTRLRGGKGFTFCNDCGERLALPEAHEPIRLTQLEQVQVETQRRIADQRTRFEQTIFRVQAYVKDQGVKVPECFISYAWGDPPQDRWVERNLATDLQKAGINVVLDRWENARIGKSVPRFVDRVATSDRIVVVGTPRYRQKYDNQEPMRPFVLAAEGDLIGKRMIGTEAGKECILPVLLTGTEETSFPPLLQGRVYADLRNDRDYFVTVFDLILSLYQIPFNDQAVVDLRESLGAMDRD
jgi:WD40 repeat protein